MKFRIKCCKTDTPEKTWWEDYEKDIEDAEIWAIETVDSFNKTLRPGEKHRTLIEVEVEVEGDENNEELHRWDKDITKMSSIFRGRVYDGMKCEKCGITGKRYGLTSYVKIDSKYKKKAFKKCNTSIIEMRG
jgi:hypothetical protein